MKRIATIIVSAFLAFIVPSSVHAASFGVSIYGEEAFESATTLTASVHSYSDISLEFGGIMAMYMDLNYDSSKINVAVSALNGFSLTRNGSILVLDSANGVGAGTPILSLYVTNVGLANGESTTITLSNISGSDSDKNAYAAGTSKAVRFVKYEPEPAPDPTPAPAPEPDPTPAPSPSQNTNQNNIQPQNNNQTQNTEQKQEDKQEDSDKKEDDKKDEENKTESDKKDESTEEKDVEPLLTTGNTSSNSSSNSCSNPNPVLIMFIVLLSLTIIGLLLYIFLAKKKNSNTTVKPKKEAKK